MQHQQAPLQVIPRTAGGGARYPPTPGQDGYLPTYPQQVSTIPQGTTYSTALYPVSNGSAQIHPATQFTCVNPGSEYYNNTNLMHSSNHLNTQVVYSQAPGVGATTPSTQFAQQQQAQGGITPSTVTMRHHNSVKLFVGQVPAVSTEEELLNLFSRYGNVVEVAIMRTATGRSKGSAWVRYETLEEAMLAIEKLNGQFILAPQTNALRVQLAAAAPASRNKSNTGNAVNHLNHQNITGTPNSDAQPAPTNFFAPVPQFGFQQPASDYYYPYATQLPPQQPVTAYPISGGNNEMNQSKIIGNSGGQTVAMSYDPAKYYPQQMGQAFSIQGEATAQQRFTQPAQTTMSGAPAQMTMQAGYPNPAYLGTTQTQEHTQ